MKFIICSYLKNDDLNSMGHVVDRWPSDFQVAEIEDPEADGPPIHAIRHMANLDAQAEMERCGDKYTCIRYEHILISDGSIYGKCEGAEGPWAELRGGWTAKFLGDLQEQAAKAKADRDAEQLAEREKSERASLQRLLEKYPDATGVAKS